MKEAELLIIIKEAELLIIMKEAELLIIMRAMFIQSIIFVHQKQRVI